MRRLRGEFWVCLLALSASGAISLPAARPARDVPTGTWRGSAWWQGSRLELSVRLFVEGTLVRATLSSPDLLLLDQPLDSVRVSGRRVRFVTPDEHPVAFEGVVEGDSLRGTGAVSVVPGVVTPGRVLPALRFALGRGADSSSPQYAAHALRFASGDARLAGTLFMPAAGEHRQAGVVILQGSSTNLRRDYEYYADHFARAGMAVLTFDKRGNGESSGDYGAATYELLADDAAAAVECLRAQPGVDPARVGIWGLSQGAFIAPLAAARVPALRFIVAVSAPGMPIGESAAYQDSVRLTSAAFDRADVQRMLTLNRRLLDWLRTGRDQGELVALLAEAADTRWRRASSLPARLPSGTALKGWYWRGRTLDPAPWWRAVHVPVLAVYGAADELVPARASARSIERALHQARNRNVTVQVFPGANHVIRTLPVVAGGKWDWPRATPGYIEQVTQWMLEQTLAEPRQRAR